MAESRFFAAILAAMALSAGAFVCPPEELEAAKRNLPEGATCGGTCNRAGTCALGLQCKQPEKKLPFNIGVLGAIMGTQPEGVCTREGQPVNRDAVNAGVALLNARMNSAHMFVPVSTLEVLATPGKDGTLFDITVEVVCMRPWLSHSDEPLAKQSALSLVGLDRTLNDVLCVLNLVHYSQAECHALFAQATYVRQFADLAESAEKQAVASLPLLRSLPLRRPLATVTQWLKGVGAVAAGVEAGLLSKVRDQMSERVTEVEKRCPRWGDLVDDATIKEDSLQLQMVVNKDIPALPEKVRDLWHMMSTAAGVTEALRADAPQKNANLSNVMHLAQNALTFGKRTVNVAAACKVAFATAPSPTDLAAILKMKASLPGALVQRLQAKLEGKLAAADVGSKRAAQAPACASDDARAPERARK